jgi:hypothetical protein
MKKENNIPQTIDNQLIEWRKKFAKEIPERVGLAFYTNEKGETEVEVYFVDDNMWMSQQITSNLFDVEEHTITYHLQEIFKSGELDEISTTRKIRVLRVERQLPTTMQQWIEFMNDYLKLNSLPVIKGLGNCLILYGYPCYCTYL